MAGMRVQRYGIRDMEMYELKEKEDTHVGGSSGCSCCKRMDSSDPTFSHRVAGTNTRLADALLDRK